MEQQLNTPIAYRDMYFSVYFRPQEEGEEVIENHADYVVCIFKTKERTATLNMDASQTYEKALEIGKALIDRCVEVDGNSKLVKDVKYDYDYGFKIKKNNQYDEYPYFHEVYEISTGKVIFSSAWDDGEFWESQASAAQYAQDKILDLRCQNMYK